MLEEMPNAKQPNDGWCECGFHVSRCECGNTRLLVERELVERGWLYANITNLETALRDYRNQGRSGNIKDIADFVANKLHDETE